MSDRAWWVSVGVTLLALVLLGLSGCAGNREWTKFNTVAQTTYTALHVVDWMQTRQIAKNPDKYTEGVNPILGEHPSVGRVDAWFVAAGLANFGISYALPHPYREMWQVGSSGVEIQMFMMNKAAGIAIKW